MCNHVWPMLVWLWWFVDDCFQATIWKQWTKMAFLFFTSFVLFFVLLIYFDLVWHQTMNFNYHNENFWWIYAAKPIKIACWIYLFIYFLLSFLFSFEKKNCWNDTKCFGKMSNGFTLYIKYFYDTYTQNKRPYRIEAMAKCTILFILWIGSSRKSHYKFLWFIEFYCDLSKQIVLSILSSNEPKS